MSGPGPYSGVHVVDLDTDESGAYATMLLAELGAEVTRVDSRPLDSKPWLRLWNRSKSLVRLDPPISGSGPALLGMMRGADVLVRTVTPGCQQPYGLDPDVLRTANPRLISCTITPFGRTGPLSGLAGDEGVVAAHAGIFGDQGGWHDAPVRVRLPIPTYGAAFLAAGAIGAALVERESSGIGQEVETSLYAGALAMQAGTLVSGPAVRSWTRDATDQLGANPVYRLYRCADAQWLMITCGTNTFWNKFCIALGRFEWTEDQRYAGAPWNIEPAHRQALVKEIAHIIGGQPASHWLSILDEADVPCGLVHTRDRFLEHPQASESGAVRTERDDALGCVTWVASPVTVTSRSSAAHPRRPWATEERSGPLSGVRVLDLTGYIAGSYAVSLLADLGADVLKVESPGGDGFRMLGGSFQAWNRGKRGLIADLRTEGGRRVVWDLVRWADVVAENFRPGAAARLGVDEGTVRKLNPCVVYLSLSGFGTRGPMANRPAFDPLIQAHTGIMASQAQEGQPTFLRVAVADYAASLLGCFGAISGLLSAIRRGSGAMVETSLLAAGVAVQAAQLIRREGEPFERQQWSRMGKDAAHRIYEARQGYVYVSCGDDEAFAAAVRALGLAELAEQYPDARSRNRADAEIALRMAAAISTLEASAAEELLLAAGVMCSQVRHSSDCHDDPQARHLGLSVRADTQIGPVSQMGPPFSFSRTVLEPGRRAPGHGEHTDTVLGELGFSPELIAELRADGAVV